MTRFLCLARAQRAAIGAEMVPLLAEEAKKRQGNRNDLRGNVAESKGPTTSVLINTEVGKGKAVRNNPKACVWSQRSPGDRMPRKEDITRHEHGSAECLVRFLGDKNWGVSHARTSDFHFFLLSSASRR